MAPKKVPAERREVTLKDKKGDVNNRTRTKMFMGLFRTDGLSICAEDIAGLSDLSVMQVSTRPEKEGSGSGVGSRVMIHSLHQTDEQSLFESTAQQ